VDAKSGGLCWVVFAKWEDVQQWPDVDPLTGLCNTSIMLKAGCTWYELKLPDRDRKFKENLQKSSAGPFWKMQVQGYVAGNNSVHTLSAAAMPFHQYVVMAADRDGQIRFIGNSDSGAEVVIDYSSGEKDESRKRTMSFDWEHHLPAPIYTGQLDDIQTDVILPPFADTADPDLGEFNDDFNDDYN
jgi:hypothetical protein